MRRRAELNDFEHFIMPKSQETVHYARNGSPSEVLNVCVQADMRRFWREILEWAMDSDVYHLTENRLNYIGESSDYPTRLDDEIKSYSFSPARWKRLWILYQIGTLPKQCLFSDHPTNPRALSRTIHFATSSAVFPGRELTTISSSRFPPICLESVSG